MTTQLRNHTLMAFVIAALTIATAANAATVTVVASQDHIIRRGPPVDQGLHIKQSTNNSTDRVAMIRFDSWAFNSPEVTSATFLFTAHSDTVTNFQGGPYDYRVWGVNNGDPQDEAFVEGGYNPSVSDGIYDGSTNLIDETQLTPLGDFSAVAGTQVSLSSPELLSFLQNDTNNIATLVIERLDNGNNSVFLDRNTATPPRLVLDIPAPAALPAGLMLLGLVAIKRRK